MTRYFRVTLFSLIGFLLATQSSEQLRAADPPASRLADATSAEKARNIVLFVTDDQSPTMGCYGDPIAKTPAMDRLAADGTRFTHAFCTTASCSASRSVILTGLFNHANGHYGHEHRYHHFSSYSWVNSLPVLLGKAGYRTARAGKYHVAPEDVYRFETTIRGSSRNPVEMAENAAEFIQASSSRPFFLYFCTSDPHRGGGRLAEGSRPDRFGNKDQPRKGLKKVTYNPTEVPVPPFLPDTTACREELAQYYESVSRVDQGLGRLVQILKEAGLYESTLIIFTSDHGMAFPGGKTTVYEGGLNVPLLVRSPHAARHGVVCDAMISFVDLTPTILDFAQALDPQTNSVKPKIASMVAGRQSQNLRRVSFHGRSFLSVLEQDHPKGWDQVYASHTFHEITMYYPMRVVRGRRYKLIWNIAFQLPYPSSSDLWASSTWQAQYQQGPQAKYGPWTIGSYLQRPEFELFDLKSDPHESQNLASDPSHAQTLAKLKDDLKSFQKETADPWMIKWKYD